MPRDEEFSVYAARASAWDLRVKLHDVREQRDTLSWSLARLKSVTNVIDSIKFCVSFNVPPGKYRS